MIEVSGVRSSWDTEATNSSFTRSARMKSVTSLYASAAPAKLPSLPRTERAETDSARCDSGSSPTQIRQSSNSSPCDGAVRRHLLAGQLGGAVGCVHVAELTGLAAVALGVGQPHEVDVPLVQGPVGTGVVQEHEADVDGVQDRLGEPALLVDRVHRQRELGAPLGGVGVPRLDLLEAAGEGERGPGGDERDHQRARQVHPAGAEVQDGGDADQHQRRRRRRRSRRACRRAAPARGRG